MRLKTCLLLLISWCSVALAAPKQVHLEYEVKRSGSLFATVKEDFSQDGNTYRIQSVTKGMGIYALFGERVLISTGEVTKDGLKPKHFELKQGKSPSKTLVADFDWANQQVNMQVKGKLKTEPIKAGTQDLASYAYQFMFKPPQPGGVSVTLSTGKKINTYQYQAAAIGQHNIAGQAQEILQLDTQAGEDTKQLWLTSNMHYLLVRYQQQEDGNLLEQVLTKISIE